MRTLTPGMVDAISGSAPDARAVAYAWYDGELAEKDPLPLGNWSITWDGDDNTLIQGKGSFTVADGSGRLAPWGFDEPLSAAGSKLQVSFVCGNESVDLASLTISANQPTEQWRVVGPALVWVPGGASIPVTADDLTLLVQDAPFITPEAPPAGATVIGEVRRLLTGICPVTLAAGVTDKPVPASIIYKDDRLAAVFDLVKSLNCRYRMTGNGQLEIYPLTRTDPVWTIRGKDGGALVSLNRSQARADLINGVVSTSSSPSVEIQRTAWIEAGPLRLDGPFGRKVKRHNAIADTADGVLADAQTELDNSMLLKTVPLKVMCTPHPGIQIGDWVRLAQPVIDGSEFPLDGRVSYVQLKGSPQGVEAMQLVVDCALSDVQAVGLYVRRAS
ncbi:MAG: hypothetical protein M3O29_08200 [Actinomycetota bacterium]|nr:hypothetical protein [Actinomycetota bacterium]